MKGEECHMSQPEGIKTSFEDVSQVVKKVKVEVSREFLEERLEKAYKKLMKSAKIKGFRPGKAPLSIIKSRYRESVVEQLEEELVREGSMEAIKERKMKAVAITRIEDGKYHEGKEFTFTAHIEILPEIDPEGYMGIKVTGEAPEVSDEEVERELEMLRESHAVYKPVERESMEGDYLDISFKSFEGNQVLNETNDTVYVIGGPSSLGEEFDEQMKGKKGGDFCDFEISYPGDFQVETVRGKTIRYEIEVKSVKEKELPDLDDEFAKSLPDIDDLAALKNEARKSLIHRKEQDIETKQKEEIINTIIEKNPMEVPETVVEDEIRGELQGMEARLSSQGIDFDPSKINVEALKEKYRDGAERSVKTSLLFHSIGEKEGITVTDEEIEKELKGMSERYNISYENVASYYGDEKRKESLRDTLGEKKVIDFLLKNAEKDAEKKSSEQEDQGTVKEQENN